jgi:hypothetical protein
MEEYILNPNQNESLSMKLCRIEEEEMTQLWDMFTDNMIEDKYSNPNPDMMQFLEQSVIELASGEEIGINVNGTGAYLLKIFFQHFTSNGESYSFRFQNIAGDGAILEED